MLYELRTTFRIDADYQVVDDGVDTPAKMVRWLHGYLPTKAAMGSNGAPAQWTGSRLIATADGRDGPAPRRVAEVVYQLVTRYDDVFAATADRLRIRAAVEHAGPSAVQQAAAQMDFEVFRVYDEDELADWQEPTKAKITYP